MSGLRQVAIVVEGQTERAFVDQILGPYLWERGVLPTAVIVATSRAANGAKFAGGGAWKHYEKDIRNLLGATHFEVVSTLIDFYAYPSDGPGETCARPHKARECVRHRESAMGGRIGSTRFLPHVVLHEFETWVIAAALDVPDVLGDMGVAACLQQHAAQVGGDVELLNDSEATAPSKRVRGCWPEYDKVVDGVAVLAESGIDRVASVCPRLKQWIDALCATPTISRCPSKPPTTPPADPGG